MFSSNGLINIKNILIINIILSLLISLILYKKIFEIKDLTIELHCEGLEKSSEHRVHRSGYHYKDDNTYVFTVCNNFLNKTSVSNKILIIEPDNETYIRNFILLNIVSSERNKLKNKIKELDIEKNIFEFQKYSLLFRILEENKSHKSRVTLEPISKLYNFIFDSSKFSYHFINFLNLIYFIICLILIYFILKRTFYLEDKLILFLISLNICLFPLFIIYFLSFYKEPVILSSFLLILANFVNFYKHRRSWKHFAIFTLMIILSFQLINVYKQIYLLIYLSSLIIASTFIIFKLEEKIHKFYIFLQLALVFFFSFNFHQDIFKEIQTQIIKKKEIYNNFFNKNTNELTGTDTLEVVLKKNRKANDGKPFDRVQQDNKHLFSDPDETKIIGYKPLNCFFINKLYCKRFNNLFFRIYAIKNDTLKENRGNPNTINNFRYKGTLDILLKIPISLKGYIMPVLIRSDLKVIVLSLFKVFLSTMLVFILYKLLSNNNKLFFEKVFLQIIIFLPIIILINLVTSNFFTYHRYMFPFNVYIFLIIYGYLAKNFSNEKNQYYNKFWS